MIRNEKQQKRYSALDERIRELSETTGDNNTAVSYTHLCVYYTDAMRIAGQRNCAQSMNIITYEKGVTVKVRNSYYL